MRNRIPFVCLVVLLACVHAGATRVALTAADARAQVRLKDITARVEAKEGIFSISDPRYALRMRSEKASDAFGTRSWAVWDAIDRKGVLDLRFYLRGDGSGRWLAKLVCRNRSRQSLHMSRIVVIDGFRPGSWVGSRALDTSTGRTVAVQPGRQYGGGDVVAVNRPSLTCGFLSAGQFPCIVSASATQDGMRVLASNPANGFELRPGAELPSAPVWLSSGGDPSAELDRWRALAARFGSGKSVPRPVPTWYPARDSLASELDWLSYLTVIHHVAVGAMASGQDETARRLLPPLSSRGRIVDLWERDTPVVVEQSLRLGEEAWRVVGLFNWKTAPVDIDLNLDRLWDESRYGTPGLPGDPARLGTTDRRYIVYDFWARKYLGEYDGALALSLPARSARIIVVREWTNHPRILAVGDHIGQGVCELLDAVWEGPITTLAGTTSGVARGEDTIVRLYKSSDWKVRSIAAGGKSIFWEEHEHDVVRFHVPDKDGPVSWRVTFDGNAGPGPDERPMEPGLILTTAQRP